MASLTITSGGSQPVFATDTLNGPQLAATTTYTPAGVPTNFNGKLAITFLSSTNCKKSM